MKDEPLAECPHCKAKSPDFKRLIGSGAGIVFKGSGFYETDYKGSSSKVSKGPNPSEGSQSGSCEKKSGCCSK